jgi:hypothetical protein
MRVVGLNQIGTEMFYLENFQKTEIIFSGTACHPRRSHLRFVLGVRQLRVSFAFQDMSPGALFKFFTLTRTDVRSEAFIVRRCRVGPCSLTTLG